jgi:hypothetical protein
MRKLILASIVGVALVSATLVARGSFLHCEGEAAMADGALAAEKATDSGGCDPSQCAPPSSSTAVAAAQSRGARGSVRGAYDPAMAMCSFSCAAKITFREQDLQAQPGVHDGQLARCPVSGVVFKADVQRPRVHLATGDYVTCCDHCATKLVQAPARFINL